MIPENIPIEQAKEILKKQLESIPKDSIKNLMKRRFIAKQIVKLCDRQINNLNAKIKAIQTL